MYIDDLFAQLRSSGVGCYVGDTYAGAFGYADDLVLIAPCLSSMNLMIETCEKYAQCYQIIFNPTKSKLMCYNVDTSNLHVQLCGKSVNIVTHETYLGNYIGDDIHETRLHTTLFCLQTCLHL